MVDILLYIFFGASAIFFTTFAVGLVVDFFFPISGRSWNFSIARLKAARHFAIKNEVGFEPDFVEELKQWDHPSLVATAHALEALQLLNDQSQPIDDVLNFSRQFREGTLSTIAGLNRQGLTSKLQDVRAEIVVLKTLCNISCENRLNLQEVSDHFSDKEKAARIAEVQPYLYRILSGNSPEGNLIDVHVCLLILWQLGLNPEKDEFLQEYVYRYIVSTYRDSNIPSFALTPVSSNTCLTACVFAVRLANTMQIKERLEYQFINIEAFVKSCWSKEEFAFATTPDALPNIVHTHSIVYLDKKKKVDWKLEDLPGYSEKIENFVDSCRTREGGYSFRPGMKSNVFATRLAKQIYDLLNIETPQDRVEETITFLHSLKDKKSGGFLGFSRASKERVAV